MKKYLIPALLFVAVLSVSAQTKKVSILGDSYSTFQGYNPENYAPFYPDAKIYSILNSGLREEINESMRVVCRHYGIQLIELKDIEKQNGHPSVNGMKSICEQLLESIE